MSSVPALHPAGRYLMDAANVVAIRMEAPPALVEKHKKWLRATGPLRAILARMKAAYDSDQPLSNDRVLVVEFAEWLDPLEACMPTARDAWRATGRYVRDQDHAIVATVDGPLAEATERAEVWASAPAVLRAADLVRFALSADAAANNGVVDVVAVRAILHQLLGQSPTR